MTTQRKTASIPLEALAAARLRAKQTRQQLGGEPAPTELLTAQELADAAPFYLVLRDYIQQLKEAREAAGLTLADLLRATMGPLTEVRGATPRTVTYPARAAALSDVWIELDFRIAAFLETITLADLGRDVALEAAIAPVSGGVAAEARPD